MERLFAPTGERGGSTRAGAAASIAAKGWGGGWWGSGGARSWGWTRSGAAARTGAWVCSGGCCRIDGRAGPNGAAGTHLPTSSNSHKRTDDRHLLLELLSGTWRLSCDDSGHFQTVDDELHRNRAEYEPHQPRQDAHACEPQPQLDEGRGRERVIGDERGQQDRRVHRDHLDRRLCLAGEHHHRRDRARACEHPDAERQDAYVLALDALGRFGRCLLLRAALRLYHVEGAQADENAARDLERADRDAKQLEDQTAAQR